MFYLVNGEGTGEMETAKRKSDRGIRGMVATGRKRFVLFDKHVYVGGVRPIFTRKEAFEWKWTIQPGKRSGK